MSSDYDRIREVGLVTGELRWPDMKTVRDKMRAQNICINGPRDGSYVSKAGTVHGPVVSGGKCQNCIDIADKSRKKTKAT